MMTIKMVSFGAALVGAGILGWYREEVREFVGCAYDAFLAHFRPPGLH